MWRAIVKHIIPSVLSLVVCYPIVELLGILVYLCGVVIVDDRVALIDDRHLIVYDRRQVRDNRRDVRQHAVVDRYKFGKLFN